MKAFALASTLALASAEMPQKLDKVFKQCDLASQLLSYGGNFNKNNINDWICLTYYESSWNTASKGGPNYDGSYDWGLFQINDYYWCYDTYSSNAAKYNDCNINCSKLIDSDISNDSTCASKIYSRHGFDAWYGWKNNCKGKDLSSWTSGCNL